MHVYLIDTGVLDSHHEFTGRLRGGVDFVDLDFIPDDCNGHGTHCAGVVGGTKWGVAKKVLMHGVKVLDCNGEGATIDVISGLQWVVDNHPKMHADEPAIISMSLGGLSSLSLNHAVRQTVDDGYPVRPSDRRLRERQKERAVRSCTRRFAGLLRGVVELEELSGGRFSRSIQ